MATPLSWYPRPPIDSGIGLHDSHLTGANPPNLFQHALNLRHAGVTWYKILAGGVNKVQRAQVYAQTGIMPIVRLYAERPHPRFLPNRDEVAAYVAVGARYFEAGNEPNLLEEVEGAINPEAVAAQWIRASDIIKSAGGIPVVYACTPGGHMNHRVFTNRFLAEVRRLGRMDSFDRAVLGIHPRPLNNPPDQPRDTGSPPNTTTWNEWTWYREAYRAALGWYIPMIATEHGYSGAGQENAEHPPMNAATWAEWNKELFLRFNPAHPRAVAPEFLAACYWLEVNVGAWVHDAPFANGTEWIGDAARQDDRAWGKSLWTIQPDWNRTGAPVPPPPEPAPNPTPPPDDIRLPAWVTVRRATVPVGTRYWHLRRAYWQDSDASGGTHHIYALNPHDAGVLLAVQWDDQVVYTALDKPANEPAGNFPMYGAVYAARLTGRGITLSDEVLGMRLPQNQHVSYFLEWELRTKGGDVPVPNPNELEAAIWAAVEARQIPINRTFALPSALIAESVREGDNGRGFDIVSPEVTLVHNEQVYVAQLAQRWSDNAKIAAYAIRGDWANVRILRRGFPPPPPAYAIDVSHPSPNWDTRPVANPDVIVLHHTGGGLAPSLATLTSKDSGVSAHYLIAKDGTIYGLVPESRRAWHAGASVFNGREDANDYSIGIEIVNNGDGVDPYPPAQIDALAWLIGDIARRRNIPRQNVTTHKAIAVPAGRKNDPRGLSLENLLNRVYGAQEAA